jgi:hypothetical protein
MQTSACWGQIAGGDDDQDAEESTRVSATVIATCPLSGSWEPSVVMRVTGARLSHHAHGSSASVIGGARGSPEVVSAAYRRREPRAHPSAAGVTLADLC